MPYQSPPPPPLSGTDDFTLFVPCQRIWKQLNFCGLKYVTDRRNSSEQPDRRPTKLREVKQEIASRWTDAVGPASLCYRCTTAAQVIQRRVDYGQARLTVCPTHPPVHILSHESGLADKRSTLLATPAQRSAVGNTDPYSRQYGFQACSHNRKKKKESISLTYVNSRTQLYFFILYEFTTTTCFGPIQ